MESIHRALAFWGVIFLLLLVPVELALVWLGDYEFAPRHPWALLAMLGVLVGIHAFMPRGIGSVLIAVTVVGALFVRLLYLGVVHFSGAGFTDDFFIHLERESVIVAWKEYRWWLIGTLLAITAAAALCMVAAKRVRSPRPAVASIILALSLSVLAWGRAGMPEWQLLRHAQRWYAPVSIDIDGAIVKRWRDSGLLDVDLIPKRRVSARAPEQARNLILLYLESIGTSLIHHPEYPGLMPYLEGLVHEHGLVPSIHHSSYITIEGLVNSMCGTLFAFERGSEALLGYEGMAESLPCLGDVLRAAGYRQVYMGGADLGFAGKGEFLSNHGYDRVLGQRHWAEQGIHQRPDTWGVSDADLFDLAFLELAELRSESRPFNLTLLTIGTHLPGYVYEECSRYSDDAPRFLSAVHCTDQLLGRFVERLKSEGQLDDTLLVITADHHIFASHRMRQVFGDSTVEDRRLPFVAMGAGSGRQPPAATGAGYDLAPTVLDLLDLTHNARFTLGRSLLRSDGSRNVFLTRYHQIVDGQTLAPVSRTCDGSGVRLGGLSLPLDPCAKNEMMAVLKHLHAAHSAAPLRLACDGGRSTRIRVPREANEPIEFAVAGEDISGSFLRNARPVSPDARGLFLMAVDRTGEVIERSHFSATEDQPMLAAQPGADGHHAWLVAWRDDETSPAGIPPWLNGNSTLAANESVGAWLIEPMTRRVLRAGAAEETGIVLEMAEADCTVLIQPSIVGAGNTHR